jgi:type IV pilus assembly protein PilM
MAQLRAWEAGVELVAAAAAAVPPECQADAPRRLDFQADKAAGLLRSGGFRGRKAILSLPAATVFVQPVRTRAMPAEEVDAAVKAELQPRLPYPVADAVIRHIPAGVVYSEQGELRERIVVAVAQSDLEAHLAMARRAGMEVVAVDIEACAVAECFARLFRRASDESRVTLFLDVGAASTQVVLARGCWMIFARNLPLGGSTLDREVAEALGIPAEQARHVRRQMVNGTEHAAAEDDLYRLLEKKIAEITDGIMDCLRYHEASFRHKPIERVIFLGGQAHNKRLCQSIAARLNLPAQVGNPMVGVRLAGAPGQVAGLDSRQPHPSWAVAIGLSLGATLAA